MSCPRLVRRQIESFTRLELYPNLTKLTMASVTESLLLPYILFDPINQFKQVCEAVGINILCPLCSRDGLSQSVIDTLLWKSGNSSRLQPRLVHDVSNHYYS